MRKRPAVRASAPFSGFSLMELLISIGIMGTAILLVVGIFTFLFHASQKGVDMTAGTVVAQSLLNEEVAGLESDSTTLKDFLSDSSYSTERVLTSGTKSLNQADFTYTIYAEDVSNLTGGASKVKQLRMVCSWWDAGGGLPGHARQGYGQLQVELIRLIYDGDF